MHNQYAKQLLSLLSEFFLVTNTAHVADFQGESKVMHYLMSADNKAPQPSEISSAMRLSTARVASILNALEEKQFVVRAVDKNDRRRTIVKLTEEGRAFYAKKVEDILSHHSLIMELIGDSDASELVRILQKIVELMKERSLPCLS